MAEVTREELAEALRAARAVILESRIDRYYPVTARLIADTLSRLEAEQNGGSHD